MNEIGQGLLLSGIGILITFSALGILIILILTLKVFFPQKHSEIEGYRFKIDDRESLKEQAAAVAVAALLDQQKGSRKSSLGSVLEDPTGNWWQRGIEHSLKKG